MINYNWDCKTVDIYPNKGEHTDVIYNVHWIVDGSTDSVIPLKGRLYGTQALNTSNITTFTPVDQLANEEIVTWTKAAMGEEQVAQIEAIIANQIELLINPVSTTLTIV